MARFLNPLSVATFLFLAVPTLAWSVTVPPDSTSPPLSAIDCVFDSGAFENLGDLSCPLTVCNAACNAPDNQAKNVLNLSNVTVGGRFVETTVYTEFTVEAASDASATTLDGTISYDVEWSGGWTLGGVFTGFNDAKTTMSIVVSDLSNHGKIVAQAPIHSMDASSAGTLPEVPIDVGVGWDKGQTSNSLTAKVIRGHTYRVGLKVHSEGKGAANANIVLDYMSGDWGLKWNELRVSIAPDFAEQLAELTKRVEKLEDDLQHHTHTYLTGKGEGHNNTVASTSEAIIRDDGPPSDDESKVLPPEQGKKPLPAPSVLTSSAPNPFNPIATITYALPERYAVALRVYDAQGRLVATLVEGEEDPGEHKATFNAAGLSSGVYYYRIEAGPFTETRKITLLK